ncbi:SRPBCC family protein [Streptomyces sp. NPDC026672]|uniref:SRPBCC family protein n=1 Tax=unclassified Streptomyces TaxID=2593676 RepID=UPI003406FB21
MNEQEAAQFIPAPPEAVRAVLLDPSALPDWNPAIHSIVAGGRAEVGVPYRITAPARLSGHLEYVGIGDDRIEVNLRVQGMREEGWWELTPQGSGTRVAHGFTHSGPLARLLSNAYRGVARLRLHRLEDRVGLIAL